MRVSCPLGHGHDIYSQNPQFICSLLIAHLPDCDSGWLGGGVLGLIPEDQLSACSSNLFSGFISTQVSF